MSMIRGPNGKGLMHAALGSLVLLTLIYSGHVSRTSASEPEPGGFPWDWSHQHLIFSNTTDREVLALIQEDPRLMHQRLRQKHALPQGGTDGIEHSFVTSMAAEGARRAGSFPLDSMPQSDITGPPAPFGLDLTTTVHAEPLRGTELDTQPLMTASVRGLKAWGMILGLLLAIGFLWRRRWRLALTTVLAGAVFMMIASCGGGGTTSHTLKRDWSASLAATKFGNVANSTSMYPAKYTFNLDATPSCANDYVVFPTGNNGKTSTNAVTPNGQASIVGFNNLYSTQGTVGGTCNQNGPSVAWAYINAACSATSSNNPILSSPVISFDGKKVAWVTSTGIVQILTIGTGGGTAAAPLCIGTSGQGSDGSSLSSLTLGNAKNNPTHGVSLSEIFVDYNSDTAYVGDDEGFLHKITPFFSATGALQEVTTPSWQALHTYSVGNLILDSNGFIEKCTASSFPNLSGVTQPNWNKTWGGTTTDVSVTWTNQGSGGGWPVYVAGSSNNLDNSKLSGPVFDFVSKNIFVGDEHGSLFYVLDPGLSTAVGSCADGATLYPCLGTPGTTTGIATGGGPQMNCSSAVPPTCFVMSSHQGFTDPVIVDSSNKLVITQFSNADGTNAKVEQTNTSLSVFHSTALATQVNVANHIGAFDNTYFTTPASGFYYVCGVNGNVTDLFRVGFTNTAGTIALGSTSGTPLQLTTTGNSANCSPLAEIFNTATSTDWLFLSVDNHGVTTTCGNQSCVMSFTLGGSMVSSVNASYVPSASQLNGTGGFIVDNVASTTSFPQASSIYFAPIASNLTCGDGNSGVGCATKLTQSGLQ